MTDLIDRNTNTNDHKEMEKIYKIKSRSILSQWLHGKRTLSSCDESSMIFKSTNVVYQGYLYKQGTRLKLWTKRYFILRLEERHMTLGYYTNKEELILCAEIPIGPGFKLIDLSSNKNIEKFELRCGTKSLILQTIYGNHSNHTNHYNNDQKDNDYKEWIKYLTEAIRWNEAMVTSKENNNQVIKYGTQVSQEIAREDEIQKILKKQFSKTSSSLTYTYSENNSNVNSNKNKDSNTNQVSNKDDTTVPTVGISKKVITTSNRLDDNENSKLKYFPSERVGYQGFMALNSRFEIPKKYKFNKIIGSGAYGVVISVFVLDNDNNKKEYAIKNIQNAFDDLTDAKRIVREIKLMKHLSHKHILSVLDMIPPVSVKTFEDVYIISELMATDLHRVIYSRHALSDEHVAFFVYQMLCGLKYIHSANVMHRDLKPSNILLNGNCELKICDFGLARGILSSSMSPSEQNNNHYNEENTFDLTEYVVTRWYRAPEIMLGCMKYTKQVDIWALGCIFGEMIARKPLFPGQDYIDQLHLIMNGLGTLNEDELYFIKNIRAKKFMIAEHHKRKENININININTNTNTNNGNHLKNIVKIFENLNMNPLGIDLMMKMLVIDPNKRIKVDDALDHPYLAGIRNKDDETIASSHFDFSFENDTLTKEKLQELIYEDILYFHPELSNIHSNSKNQDSISEE